MNDRKIQKTIELGCGNAKQPGAIGVDIFLDTDADVIADLNAPALPFKNATFDRVVMIDSLEHVADIRETLKEAARLLRPGGHIFVRVPHFSSLHAYSDFTHRHSFSAEGIRRLFDEQLKYSQYAIKGLLISELHITMWRLWRLLGIEWFANNFTVQYEKLFAFRFPAMCMEFVLILKSKTNKNSKD